MTLCKALEISRNYIFNAASINDTRRYQPITNQLIEPCRRERIVLIVICGHTRAITQICQIPALVALLIELRTHAGSCTISPP